jgi:hypothetical protein
MHWGCRRGSRSAYRERRGAPNGEGCVLDSNTRKVRAADARHPPVRRLRGTRIRRGGGAIAATSVATRGTERQDMGQCRHHDLDRFHRSSLALPTTEWTIDDPNWLANLRELERRSAGNEVAASSEQSFIPSAPDGFRGRVLTHTTPTGASYTLVSDGARFVVIKTTASLQSLKGRSVTVTLDGQGRAIVRPAPDRGLE